MRGKKRVNHIKVNKLTKLNWLRVVLTVVVLVGVITILSLPSYAYENPHENFSNNDRLCGYCHSAHSATGPNIMRAPTTLDLCLLCHDGTGSDYDVKAGLYYNGVSDTPLLAGGYDLAMGSTSTHFTDVANFVYGGQQQPMSVDCNSCHEPHGTTNYRNLRTVVNGVYNIRVEAYVAGVGEGHDYTNETESGLEVATYVYGFNEFCGACHFDYLEYYSANTRNNEYNWRHRVDVSLTGGTDDPDGDFIIEYPEPGLYTTLPTKGAPSGAILNNYRILPIELEDPGPGLDVGKYNYLVTGVNKVGESVYGYIMQVNNLMDNQKIEIQWERITNAYKYRIYRYDGDLDINNADITLFKRIAEVGDDPTSFIDDGNNMMQNISPPSTSSAKINCLTCHYPHGTRATVPDPSKPTRLRRLDNNGVCQDCHKK